MYLNFHFHRRPAGPRYRLAKKLTRRLREREDYPGNSKTVCTETETVRNAPSFSVRRLALPPVRKLLALTAVLGAAGLLVCAAAALFRSEPAACRAEDFAPLSAAVQAPAETDAASADTPKTVYLTFDDGPSKNTEKILDTLKEAGVPATFFVVSAEGNEEYLPLLQRTLAEGHCIGLHSDSHEYRRIYADADAFWADIDALQQKLEPYCGDHTYKVLRFPGGSSNTVSHKYGGSGLMEDLIPQAIEKGYAVVDWNVTAEDSVGGDPSANAIAARVIKGCREQQNAVVLMHDSATNAATAEALPVIIGWLQENGYTFDTADHLPAAETTTDRK